MMNQKQYASINRNPNHCIDQVDLGDFGKR